MALIARHLAVVAPTWHGCLRAREAQGPRQVAGAVRMQSLGLRFRCDSVVIDQASSVAVI